MSAHTPGSWEVRFFRSKSHRIDAPGWDELAVVYGNEDDDLDRQGRANARLIAAAPELLAALREAEEWMSSGNAIPVDGWGIRNKSADAERGIIVERIRAAIAKAEGKS